jgi:hypothetical protein
MSFRNSLLLILIPILVSLLTVGVASAQTITLDDLPPTTSNDRFYQDRLPVEHPSLSVNGFDCDTDCDKGIGLKNILESIYNNQDETQLRVYREILTKANKSLIANPSERWEYTTNTRRIEARAFVALVTYVLEQNGADFGVLNGITGPNLPTHEVAIDRLMEGLVNEPERDFPWAVIDASVRDDAVKWSVSMMHIARMMDLYLALENAYQHYGDPDYVNTSTTNLLGTTDKKIVLENYARETDDLDDLGNDNIVPGVSEDEVQAGNWPMKVHVAVGYAALMQQDVGLSHPYQHWVERALRSAGGDTDQNRSYHWHYQTGNVNNFGPKKFFAEGPYYLRWSLREVVPFWHAIRINGMLNYHPDFTVSDPFTSSWFLGPLQWLHDTATPDGRTPPLDDGNKVDINLSSLLNWTSAYGDAVIGQEFLWINNRVGGPAAEQEVLLVELAIPHVSGPGTKPEPNEGNQYPSQTGVNGEQQVVIRRDDISGHTHYVLLNGESGDAIHRGEGHEQPDNMQLLYYIDGKSYVMDTGYDNAAELSNSSWNNYKMHNVIAGPYGDGGLDDPENHESQVIDNKRIVSDHTDVSSLYRRQIGKVAILSAVQDIADNGGGYTVLYNEDGEVIGTGPYVNHDYSAQYERDVFFIEGDDPYLIDLNRTPSQSCEASSPGSFTPWCGYEMRYFVDTDQPVQGVTGFPGSTGGQFVRFPGIRGGGSAPSDLYIYPFVLGRKIQSKTPASSPQPGDGDLIDEWKQEARESGGSNSVVSKLKLMGHHQERLGVASVIKAGNTAPTTPKALWTYTSSARDHNGWVWKQSSDVYDVFVARTQGTDALTFNVQDADGSYPYLRLALPYGKAFGFARVRRINNQWRIDSDYQIHLEIGAPTTTLSGPTQLDAGQQGTWTAAASGGDGSYSYQWFEKFDADPDYVAVSGATASSYTNSYQGNVSLKVEVTSVGLTGDDTHDVTVDCNPCVQSPIGFSKADSTSTTNSETKTASDRGSTFVLPDQFALETSVPNPVRTQATIRYALPEASDVTLTVYDVMGREVTRLVQSAKAAGIHEVQYDTSALPSGTYLYRLRAGAFTQTKRMVVVR